MRDTIRWSAKFENNHQVLLTISLCQEVIFKVRTMTKTNTIGFLGWKMLKLRNYSIYHRYSAIKISTAMRKEKRSVCEYDTIILS